HAASHYAVAYPNHRILSSVLDQQAISIVASAEERAAASEMLQEIGVGDIVHRISKRVATLLDDPELVLGAPSSRPLDLVLRRAYDRPDLDKVAMKLAKTFGMPSVDRRRVLRNWLRPSEEYLASGGYRSRRDRVASIARRRLHARRDSARR
ncbi:MAG TPA: hypothetical protein DCS55_14990, partial [Acidimicrobiaceae bacterium]|nr:hypothetical protein [Acidimicrobiaceae bacterium]